MTRLFLLATILFILTIQLRSGDCDHGGACRSEHFFLLTDDQRWDWIGYADDRIQTPNLDRLARDGTICTNCFAVAPICAISRASILTGQYPRRHGINDFVKTFTEEQSEELYPVLLRDGGYYTGFIGKWGVGDTPEATSQGAGLFDFWAGSRVRRITGTKKIVAMC